MMQTKLRNKKMTNYEVMFGDVLGHMPVKCWTKGVEKEETAIAQLEKMSQLPFIHRHIAVMPDMHWGNGACVGSVIPTTGAIIPAAVGVDLGCFTGDTEVPTFDGKSYSLRELANNKDCFVFSFVEVIVY